MHFYDDWLIAIALLIQCFYRYKQMKQDDVKAADEIAVLRKGNLSSIEQDAAPLVRLSSKMHVNALLECFGYLCLWAFAAAGAAFPLRTLRLHRVMHAGPLFFLLAILVLIIRSRFLRREIQIAVLRLPAGIAPALRSK